MSVCFSHVKLFLALLLVNSFSTVASAQFVSGSDGSDGAFAPNQVSTVIDLSEAITASWDTPSPSPGKGVYDPAQWAVVFKYSSIDIAAPITVSFLNHPSGAPVVWLVDGDVLVEGTVGLNGGNWFDMNGVAMLFSTPGPGGFAGGAGGVGIQSGSSGFGPGGGQLVGGHGGYYSLYGNDQILPLIGGSGGAGSSSSWERTGGAGGGAILIASSGTITFNGGLISARGGSGSSGGGYSGSGWSSGGAIRLIANQVTGSGEVNVSWASSSAGVPANHGRIRVEADDINGLSLLSLPSSSATFGGPGPVFLSSSDPMIYIKTINGVLVSGDPLAGVKTSDFLTPGADVVIVIEAMKMPLIGTQTKLVLRPAQGSAIEQPVVMNGTFALSSGTVNITLPNSPTDVHVQAIFAP